jgi:O-acetyl-ADP-ribose deacetylase (regulator of RNase III)
MQSFFLVVNAMKEKAKVKTIQGDLLVLAEAGVFEVIAHGCNCFCTMGGGIARGVRAKFPAAYEADCATPQGDRSKLGTCTFAECPTAAGSVVVVNAYTQFDYSGRGVKVDYGAVRSCMAWIRTHYAGKSIGLPKIGAGLAGGDWSRIEAIIREELAGEDVTIVEFVPGG